MPLEPKYRIQAVAEMTGIPTGTLRAWERRYGVPQPRRSDNRYRLYSDQDVAAVQTVSRLCDDGLAPSEAARMVRERLERGEDLSVQAPAPKHPRAESSDWDAVVDDIVAAASRFDSTELERAVRRAVVMGPALEIYERAYAPALRAMGDRWAQGVTGVGEEHLASDAIKSTLRTLVSLTQPVNARRTILLACTAHETHALVLDGVALLAAQKGWRTTTLGARTPPDALGAAVRGLEPDAIGLSMTVPFEGGDPGLLFHAYARACAGRPWIVGGAAARAHVREIQAAGGRFAAELHDLEPFLAGAAIPTA